ncbi:PhzF family phenazine biosynthesis protein [Loktanella sp. SALINAS62]|uniref:PhzF family phenazine biosynthesis protein n=1 Tax=Loktanella sp. SALINAS62 TaxID=2706124 RepID=UPI001B8BF773|nr:PhzF family phenazine biosynthesis protein [Loktanella sp. SALINAS62]MBS1303713.1 PhzF family phenazine biosynthesis protein [Loktanella sp. SALINAS62]
MTAYVVYDVFTDTPFGGNQLAVFPDGEAIKDHELQTLASEFNFSEVVFVYPPDDLRHTAKLRIFTPTMEIPFAGHPIIGTAVALCKLGFPPDMTLETGAGPIPCEVTGNSAAFVTTVPLNRTATPAPDLVARALGITADGIDTTVHVPLQAGVGLAFTIVQLADRATLSRCQPDIAAMRQARDLYPAGLDFATLAYVRDGSTVHARMFAPLDNIPEDPATGSAAAALAALLRDVTGTDQDLTIHQGDDMGRPSVIRAQSDANGVRIAGQACHIMEGRVVY